MNKLITIKELTEQTGLPVAWIKREADEGRLPCIHVGRRRYFDAEAVEAALIERQNKGMPDDE